MCCRVPGAVGSPDYAQCWAGLCRRTRPASSVAAAAVRNGHDGSGRGCGVCCACLHTCVLDMCVWQVLVPTPVEAALVAQVANMLVVRVLVVIRYVHRRLETAVLARWPSGRQSLSYLRHTRHTRISPSCFVEYLFLAVCGGAAPQSSKNARGSCKLRSANGHTRLNT